MRLLDTDILCIHIIPYLEIRDLHALYSTCSRAAALVELAKNWVELYRATFEGVYVDCGTPFLSFWHRYNAKMQGSPLVSYPRAIRAMCSSFEQSVLAVLGTDGALYGVESQRSFEKIFGLDHYLYAIEANGTVSAWTSKQSCARFNLGVKVAKSCSVGFLCAALTDAGVYWWQKPHGPHSKMDYEHISIPLQPDDIAVTRYGLVILSQGDLYELKLLDALLRPTQSSLEVLARGRFSHIEQAGEWFAAHSPAYTLVGNGRESFGLNEGVQSLQMIGDHVYTLGSDGVLKCDGVEQAGKYSQIVTCESLYALRVL